MVSLRNYNILHCSSLGHESKTIQMIVFKLNVLIDGNLETFSVKESLLYPVPYLKNRSLNNIARTQFKGLN